MTTRGHQLRSAAGETVDRLERKCTKRYDGEREILLARREWFTATPKWNWAVIAGRMSAISATAIAPASLAPAVLAPTHAGFLEEKAA